MATTQRARPVALIVLDGWGYRPETDGNAIALANTPTWDSLWGRGSRTLLEASGLRVGLPAGQMGNSEVGHLNLGAGRVVMQDLVRISSAITGGSFYTNPALVGACRQVKSNGGTLHLLGLIGSGGVHAIDTHLIALIELAKRERLEKVAIHALLDGRDTLPKSAFGFMKELLEYIAQTGSPAKIASVSGRYYAMDRDQQWDRTSSPTAPSCTAKARRSPIPSRQFAAYDAAKTDEFILPVVVAERGNPVAPMRDGDAVACFNYAPTECVRSFARCVDPAFERFRCRSRPKVWSPRSRITTRLSRPGAFAPTSMDRILAEVLSARGLCSEDGGNREVPACALTSSMAASSCLTRASIE